MRKTLLITATAALLCGPAHAGWNGQWNELAHTTEDAQSALQRQEAQDMAEMCSKPWELSPSAIQSCVVSGLLNYREPQTRRQAGEAYDDDNMDTDALIDHLAPGDTLEVDPQ